jgi:hypothetical protein
VDVGRVLDHAARIARREREVLDRRVEGVGRVDFAVGLADEALVLADCIESGAAEGRGFDLGDLEPCDRRLRDG